MSNITAVYAANTILTLCFDNNRPVRNLDLQQFLYIMFAAYLQQTGHELFSEPFEAWNCGIVCPSVYNKFQCFKDRPIKRRAADASGHVTVLNPAGDKAVRHILADIQYLYLPEMDSVLHSKLCGPGTAWEKTHTAGHEILLPPDIKKDPWLEELK